MAFNESAINELAFNEGITESLVGVVVLAGSASVVETSPTSVVSIVGLVQERNLFSLVSLKGDTHRRNYDGQIAIKGEVHEGSVQGAVRLVGVVRRLDAPLGPHFIGSSTPVDVLPEVGSAIFTRWEEVPAKEIVLHRHWDLHEHGRARFDDTRKAWRLEMEVGIAKHNEVVTFIVNHVWAGKAFYFYDLHGNGYQYDPTGVLTSGRYKVRFVEEDFPRGYSVGERFRIPFSIIEVD